MEKKKVCQRGWEFAQIYGIDGEVALCSWAVASGFKPTVGRLSENSMKEIWHSNDVEMFRESLLDGSYRFCQVEKCPWLANNSLDEHLIEADRTDYPRELYLAYERGCNYSCTCCVDKNNEELHYPEAKAKIQKVESEIREFLDSVHIIGANGRGELFTSPNILKMLHDWEPNEENPENISVVLETNGSLFNEKNWKQIENLGKYRVKVSITVMSFEEKTYQFLAGTKLPVSNLVNNLHFVQKLRETGVIDEFEIGTVVQERNFREMPEFARRCIEEFGVDCVRLRPYFPFGDIDPMYKWIYDIRIPHHPYYSEYVEMLKDPIFENPKVLMWAGDETSKQGKNPFEKDKENFDILKYLATDRLIKGSLTKQFKKRGFDKVAVYGYGFVGDLLVRILNETEIDVECIIDKSHTPGCYDGVQLNNIAETTISADTPIVVTTPFFFEEIKAIIADSGRSNEVINLKDIMTDIYR